ncbi:hypothetical protein HK405_012048 [Cladochytrium tenue]|nr:hypothetical protein HK405_012048 [Cladochytrium tenue]
MTPSEGFLLLVGAMVSQAVIKRSGEGLTPTRSRLRWHLDVEAMPPTQTAWSTNARHFSKFDKEFTRKLNWEFMQQFTSQAFHKSLPDIVAASNFARAKTVPRILELACGPGLSALCLVECLRDAGVLECEIVVTDYEQGMVDNAKDNWVTPEEMTVKADFLAANGMEAPHSSGQGSMAWGEPGVLTRAVEAARFEAESVSEQVVQCDVHIAGSELALLGASLTSNPGMTAAVLHVLSETEIGQNGQSFGWEFEAAVKRQEGDGVTWNDLLALPMPLSHSSLRGDDGDDIGMDGVDPDNSCNLSSSAFRRSNPRRNHLPSFLLITGRET